MVIVDRAAVPGCGIIYEYTIFDGWTAVITANRASTAAVIIITIGVTVCYGKAINNRIFTLSVIKKKPR